MRQCWKQVFQGVGTSCAHGAVVGLDRVPMSPRARAVYCDDVAGAEDKEDSVTTQQLD